LGPCAISVTYVTIYIFLIKKAYDFFSLNTKHMIGLYICNQKLEVFHKVKWVRGLFQYSDILYLPDKYADVILGSTKTGNRVDACTHRNLVVDLNKARAQEIVATGGLICITLP
jgi:hypothetical protein